MSYVHMNDPDQPMIDELIRKEAELEAKLEEMEKELAYRIGAYNSMFERLNRAGAKQIELEARIAELKESLVEYGEHDGLCESRIHGRKCNCGLAEVLEKETGRC